MGGYEFGYIVPDPGSIRIWFTPAAPAGAQVRIDRTNRQVANVSPSVIPGKHSVSCRDQSSAGFSRRRTGMCFTWARNSCSKRATAACIGRRISPDLTYRPQVSVPAAADTAPALPARPREQELQETVQPNNRTAINTFCAITGRGGNDLGPAPPTAWFTLPGTAAPLGRMCLRPGSAPLARSVSSRLLTSTPPSPTPRSIATRKTIFVRTSIALATSESRGRKPTRASSAAALRASFAKAIRSAKRLVYARDLENAAFVSFDEGDHWTSLQLNMPTTSVRDMVVHGDDLVVATYGRAFWILDDLTPLRQIDRSVSTSAAFLFRPEKALRVRLDLNGDTPIPPDMPAGQNPPSGAIVDYYLSSQPSSDVKLAIYDAAGQLVREYSTGDSKPADVPAEPPPNVPDYWLGHPEPLTEHAGLNRFVWDLRYAAPPVLRHEYPISALYQNTPALPLGAMVTPGRYTVRLTVNGRTFEQPLEVAMDPRVDVSPDALAQQLTLERKILDLVASSFDFYRKAVALRQTLAGDQKQIERKPGGDAAIAALKEFDQKAQRLQGAEGGGGGGRGARQGTGISHRSTGSIGLARFHRRRPGCRAYARHADRL